LAGAGLPKNGRIPDLREPKSGTTLMEGELESVAAEALDKWDGGHARQGKTGLPPPQFWDLGVLPVGNL